MVVNGTIWGLQGDGPAIGPTTRSTIRRTAVPMMSRQSSPLPTLFLRGFIAVCRSLAAQKYDFAIRS